MSMTRRNFLKLGVGAGLGIGLGAALLPAALSPARAELVSREMYVFGTLVNLGAEGSAPQVNRALDAVEQRFLQMNRDWHAWKPGELSALNAALAEGRTLAVSAELETLLCGASRAALAAGDLFNPALGKLIALWDFHSDVQQRAAPPSAAEVATLRQSAPSMADLRFSDQHEVSSANPNVRIDLGGYAKGVALDWALDHLAAQGLENAVVNLGGNLAIAGQRDARPWHIGVRHPQGEGVIAALEAQGREAIVTSGTYERYRVWDGQRYPHIIDPRSGQPATHVTSATVIHADAAWADAAATALVVAGAQDWPRVAERMGVEQAMVIDEHGGVRMTRAIAPRVRFVGDAPAHVEVV
ncbi:MAG: FAD:protein FMN transferase [Pseudomonadota bacterium]